LEQIGWNRCPEIQFGTQTLKGFAMSTSGIIPSLFLFTLIAVVVVATVAYLLFLRKRSNRHPVEKPHLARKTMAPTKPEH
jgi:heme/copper-type cytochrome/quinol oxidase subunit 2